MSLVSLDGLKQDLADRIDQLVPMLFPNARRDGVHWRMGDITGRPSRKKGELGSLYIRRTRGSGMPAGAWKDFGSDDKGDIIDLIAAGACHGDIGGAIQWARRWLGHDAMSPADRERIEQNAARQRQRAEADAARATEARRRAGVAIWLAGGRIEGTRAEAYLAGRAIPLDRLAALHPERRPPGALRFAQQKGPDGVTRPCLVAAVVDAAGKQLGCHRTFLWVGPDGRVHKASADPAQPMPECKLSLGPIGGGFIPLWKGEDRHSLAEARDLSGVMLTEGIEDGLSSALENPTLRHIAGISLDNCRKLGGALARFGTVYWHRHREKTDSASAAGGRVTAALEAAGCRVVEVFAPDGHKDFNDAARAAAGLMPARNEGAA
jgi:hypothetical protein